MGGIRVSDIYNWHEVKDMALKNNIDRNTFTLRMNLGWDSHRAATQPKRKRKHSEEFYKWLKVARENELADNTYYCRVKNGMSYKDAANKPKQSKGRPKQNNNNIYAIFKNDVNEFEGTAEECAEHLKIKLESFNWYLIPTGRKRMENRKSDKAMMIVDLGEDEDDEEDE